MKKNTKDYSKVFTELDEIFRYLPDEMLGTVYYKEDESSRFI